MSGPSRLAVNLRSMVQYFEDGVLLGRYSMKKQIDLSSSLAKELLLDGVKALN